MASSIGSLVLFLSVTSMGGPFDHGSVGHIYPEGPGFGWGFPNGSPDAYGYFDHGDMLPLGPDRVSEYYFPRYYSAPPEQLFFPTYFNPYTTRGQRYVTYVACGGDHPAGGSAPILGDTPFNPYNETLGTTPLRPLPQFNGRVEAPPENPGRSGLRP